MQRLVESLYNSKMSKHQSPTRCSGGSLSPLIMKYLSSSSNSNSSSNSSCSSPLSIMSNSNSLLSAVDEEDVLVMDGILVREGLSNVAAGFSRSWEDFGNGRFATRSQFAHGKDHELHSTRFHIVKNKSEICRSYITGSCTFGSKCRFIHQDHVSIDSEKLVLTAEMDSPIKQDHEMMCSPVNIPNAFECEVTSNITNTSTRTTITGRGNWSPEDDGIEVTLPTSPPGKTPTREEVNEYIDSVLYGPTTAARRRLPPFAEICKP